MDKFRISALMFVLLLSYANAQHAPIFGPNLSIITYGTNSSYSGAVKLSSAYQAATYISGLLGQSYYEHYINLSGGSYYGNNSQVYFSYSVPFANGTQSSNMGSRRLGVTIIFNGSRVVRYIGPASAYVASVSAANAIDVAEGYGLFNDSARLVGLFSHNTSGYSNYSIAWAVVSHDPGKGQNYYGMYVDAVSGNVTGEFYYLPSMMQNGSLPGYAVAGNFSAFLLTPLSDRQKLDNTIYYVILAMIVAAGIVAWIKFKPKKRSRFTDVRPESFS